MFPRRECIKLVFLLLRCCCSYLADEILEPRKNVPKALLWTIVVDTANEPPMMLAISFSVSDMNEIINNSFGFVSLALFLLVSDRKAGAITLQVLSFLIKVAAIIRIHAYRPEWRGLSRGTRASHSIDILPRLLQLRFTPKSGLIYGRVFGPVLLEQCTSGHEQHSILLFPLENCSST